MHRMMAGLGAAATAGALALAAAPVAAHGFGERYDLPVPLGLYLAGAGAAVALSFVLLGVFVRGASPTYSYPRLNLLRWRAGRALVHPFITTALQIIAVASLALVIIAGIVGTAEPAENIAPTLVWIIWWVGFAYVSALLGDLWRVMNPWSATYAWAECAYAWLMPGGRLGLGLRYPAQLGVWPGVAAFAVFAWVELAYIESALPGRITQMALLYTLYLWGGMFVFGREQWLRSADVFTLAFGYLARFAPTEVRVTDPAVCGPCPAGCAPDDGGCVNCPSCFAAAPREARELNLRPYVAGLQRGGAVSASAMVFILLLLSTVSYDGFSATPLWGQMFLRLFDLVSDATFIATVGIAGFTATLMAVYALFCSLIAAASGYRIAASDAGRVFVLSLVPIALAYHLAHFLSYLLIQGQSIIPLASDPFGLGWNLLGTAGYEADVGIIGARTVWLLSVAAIVAGHVAAVYLAHIAALRTIADRGAALRSQYPMLALMVGYTMVSLWILAQPIVEPSGG